MPSRFCRFDLVCCIVLLVVWLGVSLPRLHGPIDLRWDASSYFVLGTSLAQGKGYRLLNEPGEIRAVQYPPLLPLIVALHQWALGSSDYFRVGSALRISYFLLSGAYLIAAYTLARKLLNQLMALLVGIGLALSFYSFLHISDTLYAELPFSFVSILFLLLHRRNSTPTSTALDGLLATAAYLLRTAGLALIAAWVAESLLRRRFREAVIRAVVAAIPVLLWQAYIWSVTHSDEYLHPVYSYQRAPYYYPNVTYEQNSSLLSPFRPELGRSSIQQLPRRIVRNAAEIPCSLGESSLVDATTGLPGRFYYKSSRLLRYWLIAIGSIALIGAALVARRPQWFLSLYFALALGLIVLTPWSDQFWRYVAPLTPLTLTLAFCALLSAFHWLTTGKPRRKYLVGVLMSLPIAGMLLIQGTVAVYFLKYLPPVTYYDDSGRARTRRLLGYKSHWHSLDPTFEWIRVHTPPGAIVATAVPQFAYLRSGHKTVLPPFEVDRMKALRLLDEVPVRYLVIDQLGKPGITEHYAASLVTSEPRNWSLVFTAPDTGARVYERVR